MFASLISAVKSLVPKPILPVIRETYYRIYRTFVLCWCCYVDWNERHNHVKSPIGPVPPALLRFKVSESPSLERFLSVGETACDDLLRCLEVTDIPIVSLDTILDFGCGCGRTLSWLAKRQSDKRFYGTDTDRTAILWCQENLNFAEFRTNEALPPLSYQSETFSLVYAISVFTHLNESLQLRWLEELKRILRPGGVLVISVHGERVWRKLEDEKIAQIQQKGILTTKSTKLAWVFPEWYQTTFHTRGYVEQTFSGYLEVIQYIPEGMGYQDAVVCKKLKPASHSDRKVASK